MLPVHEVDVVADELRFHRLSGRSSLDLVATIGERWRGRFERLRTPEDLGRWLVGVEPALAVAPTPEDLRVARQLRGAVELLALHAMDGTAPPSAAVDVVNEVAATPVPVPILGTAGDVGHAAPAGVDPVRAVLGGVARDAIELFGNDLRARVRECEAEDCALVFLDTSRGRRRRWCSMQGCGNRAKVRRHRAAD